MKAEQRHLFRSMLGVCGFVVASLIGVPQWAAAIGVGSSLEEVETELGKARSYIVIGNRRVLYYDRGKIELENAAVVAFELMSEEEAAALREQREAERVRLAQVKRERELELEAEGLAVRDRKLNDPAFSGSSATRRVAFWNAFARKYPQVDLPIEYQEAVRELALERKMQRREAHEYARLRELQQRVEAAERRAVDAEVAAYRESRRAGPIYPVYPYPTVFVDARTPRDLHPELAVVHAPSLVTARQGPYRARTEDGRHYDPVVQQGYLRPRGVHNAQVHNRALRTYTIPARFRPFHSSAGFAFQHPRPPPGHSGARVNVQSSGHGHGTGVSGQVRIRF